MASDHGKKGASLHCSFCDKNQHEVPKLIAGTDVYICNECLELCNEVIREEGSAAGKCSFCNKSRDEVRKLIAGTDVRICDECVELCNEIVRDDDAPLQSG